MSNDRQEELRKVIASFSEALSGNQPRPTTADQPKADQRSQALLRILQQGDIPDKWLAARQLGQFGNQLALLELEPLTSHPNQELAKAAQDAIVKITQRTASAEVPARRVTPPPPPVPPRPQPQEPPVPAQPLQPISRTPATSNPLQQTQSSGQVKQNPQAAPSTPPAPQPTEVNSAAVYAESAPISSPAPLPDPITSIPDMAPLPEPVAAMPAMAAIPARTGASLVTV